jgi:hypothetical protein
MNSYFKITFAISLICFIANTSCQRNRLKTDEKKLAKDILKQENEKDKEEQAAIEKQKADTPQHFANVRYHENRSIDAKHPPIVIDIAANLNNMKDIKLSAVASNIKYIRMEPIPGSSDQQGMKFKYYLMDSYIVAINYFGIYLYSKEGKYLRTVVKNEFTGVEFDPDDNRIRIMNQHTSKGGIPSVWSHGNSLFYNYRNNITGQRYIMEYNCTQETINSKNQFDIEHPDMIIGLGDISVDLSHGKKVPPPKKLGNGSISAPPEYFYEQMGPYLLDPNTYTKTLGRNYMMGIFSKNGDTLCTFTMFEQLKNYTKSLSRGTDSDVQYENNGKLFFRNAFNDTIFQVLPPNRLLPKYVLNLGNYKVTKQQGIDPGYDLKGKIIPDSWAESRNYIFLIFSKDNYDCPNNREKKKVKIYHALFSKANNQLHIVNSDPLDYSENILENDIDGGLPVWPLSYMVDNTGNILISAKGSELKVHVGSTKFKLSNAPTMKKSKLKQFAESLSDTDNVLMILQ